MSSWESAGSGQTGTRVPASHFLIFPWETQRFRKMNDRYPSRKKKNEFERVPEEDGTSLTRRRTGQPTNCAVQYLHNQFNLLLAGSVWAHFLFFRGFRLLFFSVSGVATQLCVVTLNPKKFNFWTKSYETFENVAYVSVCVQKYTKPLDPAGRWTLNFCSISGGDPYRKWLDWFI